MVDNLLLPRPRGHGILPVCRGDFVFRYLHCAAYAV